MRLAAFALVFFAASSMPAHAFRPLCNSLGSGGGQFDDGCGACSPDSAARWEPAALTLRFDRANVPSARGVSTGRFASDITNVIAAWNAVPGSSMVLGDGGECGLVGHGARNLTPVRPPTYRRSVTTGDLRPGRLLARRTHPLRDVRRDRRDELPLRTAGGVGVGGPVSRRPTV